MKRPRTTVLLWIANALAWSSLAVFALVQLGVFSLRPAAALPEVGRLTPRPLAVPQSSAEAGARNPFDATAGRWLAAAPGSAGAAGAGAGELRGILLLPGVQAAVTSTGTVQAGGALAGGSMVGIKGGKVLVRQQDAVSALEVPAMRRQTLQSLNSEAIAKPRAVSTPAAPTATKAAAKAAR